MEEDYQKFKDAKEVKHCEEILQFFADHRLLHDSATRLELF